jgi:hypothetical protein
VAHENDAEFENLHPTLWKREGLKTLRDVQKEEKLAWRMAFQHIGMTRREG